MLRAKKNERNNLVVLALGFGYFVILNFLKFKKSFSRVFLTNLQKSFFPNLLTPLVFHSDCVRLILDLLNKSLWSVNMLDLFNLMLLNEKQYLSLSKLIF